MSVNKKDRCLFGNKEEQLRIYNQRRTINRLQQENKQLKDKYNQLLDDEELLQMKIDKAIKVIKDDLKFGMVDNKYIRYDYSTGDLLEILEILKGDNNE